METHLVVLSPCSIWRILVPSFALHRVLQPQILDCLGRPAIIVERSAAGKAQVPARLLGRAQKSGRRRSRAGEMPTHGASSAGERAVLLCGRGRRTLLERTRRGRAADGRAHGEAAQLANAADRLRNGMMVSQAGRAAGR